MTVQEMIHSSRGMSHRVLRLSLPAYAWRQEPLRGVTSSAGVNLSAEGDYSYATSFLAHSHRSCLGRLNFWTPNVNPFWDPALGPRLGDTRGHTLSNFRPYVHALVGVPGGYDAKYKCIVATCKHFLPHATVQELCAANSNVGACLCSYNAVNGVPSCTEPWLLNDFCGDPGAGPTSSSLISDSLIRQVSSFILLAPFDARGKQPYRELSFTDVNTPHAPQLAYQGNPITDPPVGTGIILHVGGIDTRRRVQGDGPPRDVIGRLARYGKRTASGWPS
ncbi:glycoside hydrolase family 3 protein [Parathielavia appendiculata]|uniref:Glycoside hydrolase family 3 protein n=1 Tax=Parathielavia appendiculata TaxID=2587402 RepID=A0AAN6TSQ3_9PEZI|nr:glycoside hydrolase family 3 protein [Parathielavia appendiculata]